MRSTAHVTAVLALLLVVVLSMPAAAQAQSEPTYDRLPGTRISGGPSGTATFAAATFSFYSTEPSSTFECRLDGGSWAACASPTSYASLDEGDHTFYVRSVDSAGQPDPTPSRRTWTVDAIPGEEPTFDPTPGTRISSGPSGTVTATTASFSFYSTEPDSTFECRRDAGPWAPCDSPKSYSSLAPGDHAFHVRSIDSADQRDPTPSTQSWTIETAEQPAPDPPPTTTITSGPSGTVTSTTASFSFDSNEPDATFECRRDAGTWAPCSSPKSYSSLVPGTHAFHVRAIDGADQPDPTPSTRAWRIEPLAGSVLLLDGFDVANGLNGVITNEYAGWHAWDSTAPHSPVWRSDGGTLFSVAATDASGDAADRVAYTGELDNGFADKFSLTNTHSNKMRFWTKRGGFGSVRVDVDVKPLAWGADGPSSWSGFKFYLRREQGVSDSPFYTVEPIIKDGSIYIQKKCLGDTGGGNYSAGGTYYLLASRSGVDTTLGSWQRISASARTNLDGSVTLSLYRNGDLTMQAIDRGVRADGTGCAPLSAGHVGFRSDYFEYYLDDYKVTAIP
jgi:hypothetical protein